MLKIDDCSSNSWYYYYWCVYESENKCFKSRETERNNTCLCYLVLRLAQTDFATWYFVKHELEQQSITQFASLLLLFVCFFFFIIRHSLWHKHKSSRSTHSTPPPLPRERIKKRTQIQSQSIRTCNMYKQSIHITPHTTQHNSRIESVCISTVEFSGAKIRLRRVCQWAEANAYSFSRWKA